MQARRQWFALQPKCGTLGYGSSRSPTKARVQALFSKSQSFFKVRGQTLERGGKDLSSGQDWFFPHRHALQCRSPSSEGENIQADSSVSPILQTSIDSEQEKKPPLKEKPVTTSFWESKSAARILLLLVPVFWGTYGPAVRYVYEQPYSPSPSVLTLARKAVSLIFFFCFLPLEASNSSSQQSTEQVVPGGTDTVEMDSRGFSTVNQLSGYLTDAVGVEWTSAIELGLWTFLGTACQTDGLENTTATRAGFLLQTVTVLVPALSTSSGVKVKPVTWAATILALLGVTFMSLQLHGDASVTVPWSTIWSNLDISRGDLEMLLAAFFYALCTVRLGKYAAKAQAVQLSTNLMVVSTILSASWVLFDLIKICLEGSPSNGALNLDSNFLPSPSVLLAIIFSALVPGTLASLAQTIGQKVIPAAEAQVYYSLQPFWSTVFATVILKENVNLTTWVAGTMLVTAAFMASFDTLSLDEK